jgi:hypothetical protein
MATINYKRGEKKRKDRQVQENEEDNCAKDQESAQNHGYCCHQHAKVAKKEHEKFKEQVRGQKEKIIKFVDEQEQCCMHCNEDPCVFNQIEMRLCKMTKFTTTVGIMRRLQFLTTVVGRNVLSSTLPSFCGRVCTTPNHNIGVWKTVFLRFSLPSMAKSWVMKRKNNIRLLVMK